MSQKLIALVIAAISVVAVACSSSEDPTQVPATSAPTPIAKPVVEVESRTVVDIAFEDGRFDTLVAAVTAAGHAGTLLGDGPFTVFAPTDDAFAVLPDGTVEGLLADIPGLTDILLYHVVSGTVLAGDVVALDSAPILVGKEVSVVVEYGNFFIQDSQVIITDVV